ncbi:aryl-sulfate sulfotransferase [Paramagnetospirillum kuznetsovii]|uniref:Aryl-sulfate sulfotransferase n=1 Tax=Paramagnetospirillum kuznetsovii TaxID=2053833 RepID=A0A364NZN9_9PROT|nr:ribbon-helix-helix domain-containing protein [Paramagnetospirillum kuznetsovii]RAU22377.1 aryl-sulfate sulfotransferase [Paramagnetospirillum kuznetsovii]
MTIAKRSVTIAGHATSVTIEAAFWDELKGMAETRGVSVNQLVAEIDSGRDGNLSSAIRLFVLAELKARAAARTAPPSLPISCD